MRVIILAVLVLAIFPAITVQAQTVGPGMHATCAPPYPLAASANNGAGYINFCVYYPESVQPGEQFSVSSTLTAPEATSPIFLSAGTAFTANFGCTEGTPSVVVPTTNGVVGTMWTAVSTFTLSSGAERCDFSASAGLTIAVVPLQIYSGGFVLNVRTENVRVDNFNYLCDAPAIAPNAYSTTTTTCNDPNVGVDILDDTTDDGYLSVPPSSMGNISLNGTFPSTLDVNARFPREPLVAGDSDWLHILAWIAAVLFFSYLGWLFALAFAVPGLLAALSPSINTMLAGLGLDFEALTILCLLGFILELAANRFSWGGYTSGSRRLAFTRKNGA